MSLTIATGAIVCNESQLVGEISIGTRTVVHPKVSHCVKTDYLFYMKVVQVLKQVVHACHICLLMPCPSKLSKMKYFVHVFSNR